MKVRIEMTVDIDVPAWQDQMMCDGEASPAQVRRDAIAWATNEVITGMSDRGLLRDGGDGR